MPQLVRARRGRRCEYCRLPDLSPRLEPSQLGHMVARQHRNYHDGGQGDIVNRSLVLHLLAQNKAALADRFGLVSLALFGSTARDTAGPHSDIDILVSFNGPATSERYFGVQFFLEDLLGRPIDLVTDKALRPEIRPFIELEAVHV